jgi:hypothetical protein
MDLKFKKGRILVKQLSLKGLLESAVGPKVILDEVTIEEVVVLMAEAIKAVLREKEVWADDQTCPKP